MLSQAALREYLDFAVDAARRAGAATLPHFQTDISVERKEDDSPVTAADREAEELLRALIAERYADHAVLGEEFGARAAHGDAPARWIIDPIDGTQSFICGVPLYTTLVSLEWAGTCVLGVIHAPALAETVYAARGLGCWWNGKPARVSEEGELRRARLVHVGGRHFVEHHRADAYQRLIGAVGVERGFCDAYGYMLVATGRAEIALDPILSIWDAAPLLPIITEAGGRCTDFSGEATHLGETLVATNGRVHDAVLALLPD